MAFHLPSRRGSRLTSLPIVSVGKSPIPIMADLAEAAHLEASSLLIEWGRRLSLNRPMATTMPAE